MKDVVIYTKDSCPNCENAKQYLSQNNILFQEKNIDSNPNEKQELDKKRIYGVPALFVDGNFIEGFDHARIESIFNLKPH